MFNNTQFDNIRGSVIQTLKGGWNIPESYLPSLAQGSHSLPALKFHDFSMTFPHLSIFHDFSRPGKPIFIFHDFSRLFMTVGTLLATSCGNMASNSERIIEKTRNSQIMRAVQTFQNKPTDHLQNRVSPTSTLYHWGQATSRFTNVEGTVFQTFLNYKQRSCIQFITNEQVKLISFISEGGDITLGIPYVPLSWLNVTFFIHRKHWCSVQFPSKGLHTRRQNWWLVGIAEILAMSHRKIALVIIPTYCSVVIF